MKLKLLYCKYSYALALTFFLILMSGNSHAVYRWQLADSKLPLLKQSLEQYPDVFAGLSLDEKNQRVIVRVAKGIDSKSVTAVLDKFATLSTKKLLDVHIKSEMYWHPVIVDVEYSLAELQSVELQLISEERFSNLIEPLWMERSIDIINNSVRLSVSQDKRKVQKALSEHFGDRVKVVEKGAAQFASRQVAANDGLLAGGALVQRPNGGDCTSGYPMRQDSSGLIGFSIAGHCNFGNDSNDFPEIWNSNGDYMGHMLAWRVGMFVNDVFGITWPEEIDSALVFDYMFAELAEPVPQAYVGGVNSSTRRFIEGYRDPMLGESVCFSGVKTGENCTAVITDVDVTRNFIFPGLPVGFPVSGLTVAESSDGSVIAQPGDSGGPVYVKETKGFNEVLTGLGSIEGVNSGPSSTAYMVPISKVPPTGWSMVAADCSWVWVWYICS